MKTTEITEKDLYNYTIEELKEMMSDLSFCNTSVGKDNRIRETPMTLNEVISYIESGGLIENKSRTLACHLFMSRMGTPTALRAVKGLGDFIEVLDTDVLYFETATGHIRAFKKN